MKFAGADEKTRDRQEVRIIKKCIVIADDLTGGNAAAALFANEGYPVSVMLCDAKASPAESGSVCVYVTESRNIPPEQARERTGKILKQNGQADLFCKRIDSTMRGNVGAEIDEMLHRLGNAWLAAVVPSFPEAGRVVKNGVLYVHGIPLSESPGAEDPVCPVRDSRVAALLAGQYDKKIENFAQDELQKEDASERLERIYREGTRMIVFDAQNGADLARIAGLLAGCGHPVLVADPGPMSLAYYRAVCRRRFLFVIGSTCSRTREQLEQLELQRAVTPVRVELSALLGPQRERETRRIVDAVRGTFEKQEICVIAGSGLWEKGEILAGTMHGTRLSQRIAGIYGALAADCLEQCGPLDGLFACGGDIAAQVIRAAGAGGLRIQGQLQPLIAYGQLLGGHCDGMPVITKGGMAGSADALMKCAEYFENI